MYNDKTELSFWFPTGTGYHLVIVKSENCKVGQVTQLVRELIPGAKLEKEVTTELSYLLPDDQSSHFASLFRRLEEWKDELGIADLGAEATTMEEVFLR